MMEAQMDQVDWQRAHTELIRIGKAAAALDWEEGCWLRAALGARVHLRLGFGSFAEYVERILGHKPRMTEEKLRVADALANLPQLSQALREGILCWSAVRELSRVATDRTEVDWIAASMRKSVRDIERSVKGRRPGDLPSDPPRPDAERHVLRVELSAETMATVRDALAKLRRDSSTPLTDDDAFLLMARHVLRGPVDDGRASYQVALTVCERCRSGAQQGRGEQIPVSPEVVQMAECDAQHVGPPGTRAAQTIPPAVHRHVMRRHSGCCAVPGCRSAVFVDVHHVDPRADGGGHDPERLVVLCSAHHRAAHRGALIIEGTASGGFSFRHADGSEYGRVASPPTADAAARVFQALRKMGWRETESRRAVDQARTHVGVDASLQDLLRDALDRLTVTRLQCSDSAIGMRRYETHVGGRMRAPDAVPKSARVYLDDNTHATTTARFGSIFVRASA